MNECGIKFGANAALALFDPPQSCAGYLAGPFRRHCVGKTGSYQFLPSRGLHSIQTSVTRSSDIIPQTDG